MKRRHFLQFAGSALTAIGVSQLDIIQQGDKYTKALAQNTGRKLALLVGINQYSGDLTPLGGCVNDVMLQKQLLIHRFGFNPQDIITLTDSQATRKGIRTYATGTVRSPINSIYVLKAQECLSSAFTKISNKINDVFCY